MRTAPKLEGFTRESPRGQLADALADAMGECWAKHTVALDDGTEMTVRVEVDPGADLRGDGDWYGALSDYMSYRFDGRSPRPTGFDGNARKVHARDGYVWWQPPANVAPGSDAFTHLERMVRGYYRDEWTYVVVSVSVLWAEGSALKREHAVLGGVETSSPDYVREVLAELLAECGIGTADPAKAGDTPATT